MATTLRLLGAMIGWYLLLFESDTNRLAGLIILAHVGLEHRIEALRNEIRNRQ